MNVIQTINAEADSIITCGSIYGCYDETYKEFYRRNKFGDKKM